MSARGTAAGIGMALALTWSIWQIAQTEAKHPGETQQNTASLVNTGDGVAGSGTDAAGRLMGHVRQLGGEVGTLAGQAGTPAGQTPAGQ